MHTYYRKITRITVAVLIAATMIGSHLAGTVSYISLVLADWEDANTIPPYNKDRNAKTIPVFPPNGGKQDGKPHSLDQQTNFPDNKSIPPSPDHGKEMNTNDDPGGSGDSNESGDEGGPGNGKKGGMLNSAMLGALVGLLAGKNNQQGGGGASLDQLQQRAQNLQSQLDAMEEAQLREELTAAPTATATPTLTPTLTATAVATGTVTAGGTAAATTVAPPTSTSTTQTSGGK